MSAETDLTVAVLLILTVPVFALLLRQTLTEKEKGDATAPNVYFYWLVYAAPVFTAAGFLIAAAIWPIGGSK